MNRANFIGAPGFFNLNHAILMINEAFDSCGTYLVGSALKHRNFRDVDVRCIMADVEYERLFPGLSGNPTVNPLWSLMCAAISEWISSRTGLSIDFQIQKQSEANYEHFKGKRQALGVFVKQNKAAPEPGPGLKGG